MILPELLVGILLATNLPDTTQPAVLPGADLLLGPEFHLVAGKHVGLVTNHSGRLSGGTPLVDTLLARGVAVVALFGPEHGIRGDAGAGETVVDGRDPKTGIPVYSLFGEETKPTPAMLRGIDVLVYDIQDVGVRFYTYLSTMTLAMEAAAESGIPFVVCDRPDPLGGLRVDGPIRVDSLRSFVGLLPIPVIYGLTCGELARMINGERWLAGGMHADLRVVQMRGWKRTMLWKETGLPWIPPSPNIRTPDAALVYPGTCYLEGTNLSEGRGTERPFQTIGAPFIDGDALAQRLSESRLPGVRFGSARFTPSTSKFSGVLCRGVTIEVVDRHTYDPLLVGLTLMRDLLTDGNPRISFQERWFNRLMGQPKVLESLRHGADPQIIQKGWKADIERFRGNSAKYQLYPSL